MKNPALVQAVILSEALFVNRNKWKQTRKGTLRKRKYPTTLQCYSNITKEVGNFNNYGVD